jgi:Fe-S oxidoreductase
MPEVIHYTQLLHELIKDGKLKVSSFNAKVTYHDPCFLGRYNNIYDEPREVLRSIPGIELIEMKRSREYAFYCGGGSGNFYFGFWKGKDVANRIRVREAYETGAKIIATACGGCLTMLNDGMKSEDLEDKIDIMDIAEIVKKALS